MSNTFTDCDIIKIVFLVSEGLLLVVRSSIGLWIVSWFVGPKFYFAMCWVGWRNWTHGQLCANIMVSGTYWNSLPPDVTSAPTLTVYRNRLKT